MNPSGTLLATGGKNVTTIGVYRLPEITAHCVLQVSLLYVSLKFYSCEASGRKIVLNSSSVEFLKLVHM